MEAIDRTDFRFSHRAGVAGAFIVGFLVLAVTLAFFRRRVPLEQRKVLTAVVAVHVPRLE